jgi:hypothetical protein
MLYRICQVLGDDIANQMQFAYFQYQRQNLKYMKP